MQTKVSPIVVIVVLIIVLAIVGAYGYKKVVAPPPSAHGIGPNGQPMTDADVKNIINKMSGGKGQAVPTGSGIK